MIFDSWQIATEHKKWFDPKKVIIARDEKEARKTEYSEYPLKPFFKDAADTDVYKSDDTQWTSKLGYKYDKVLPSTQPVVINHVKMLRRMVNTELSMTRAETNELLPPERKTDNDLIINVRYNR